MLKMLRMRQIGLSILLLTVPLGLFGCVQALDSELTRVEDEDNEVDLSAQGLKEDDELLGQDREAAVQQALGDWRVQGIRSILESEGKVMELDMAQVFTFQRGLHPGTLVFLPFGDTLMSYMVFRDKSHVALTPYIPGGRFWAVNDPKERKEILQWLRSQGVFQWFEEVSKKQERRLVPGRTLLLQDEQKGVAFFVFTRPAKGQASSVSAQIVLLGDEMEGGGFSSLDPSTGTARTTSMFKLDPGGGGGSLTFQILGLTYVRGYVKGIPGVPYFMGTHITQSNLADCVTVEGWLGSGQDQPTGSAVDHCGGSGKTSATCNTYFQAHVCEDMSADGESYHTATYQGRTIETWSSGSDFVSCP